MVLLDYSKLEVNIIKIFLNLVISVFFYCFAMFIAVRGEFFEFSFEIIFFIIIMLLLAVFIIKYICSLYKYTKKIPLYIFLFLFIIAIICCFYYSDMWIILFLFISILYALYTLSLVIYYGIRHRRFIKIYESMIKFEQYSPNFFGVFFIFIAYYVYLAAMVVRAATPETNDNGYLMYIFFPLVILRFIRIPCYRLLLDYQYVFSLCPLSEYGKIPISVITEPISYIKKVVNKKNVDKDVVKRWFHFFIEKYLKDVSLDIEQKLIIFNNIKTDETNENKSQKLLANKDNNKCVMHNLDEAINKIDTLMGRLVYSGTNLIGILYNMKLYLEKINILQKDKQKYNETINIINKRFIPYVEYLVDTYLQNILLKDETLNHIQEKIVQSLKNMLEMFKSMYESNMEYLSYNIENDMNAIELLNKQEGLKKDIIK